MIDVDRIQQRLDELGLSPFSAARKAGLESGYVRDILRGRVREPGSVKLGKLADVLRCSPEYLLGLTDDPGAVRALPVARHAVPLSIRHEVAAGTWIAVDEQAEEPIGEFEVPPYAGVPLMAQWLERAKGDSMDKVIPDGALVHVVDAIEIGYTPREGDLVIACRTRAQGAFRERSIKQISIATGRLELWPRSNNPRWSTPLEIIADIGPEEDVQVDIVGKVVGVYIRL